MLEIKKWFYRKKGEKVVKALINNEFKANYFENTEQCLNYVKDIVKQFDTIGFGGSVTNLYQLKIPELCEQMGKTVYNHNKSGLSAKEKLELRKKELSCDLFITSTNALTENGELVNIDGVGNRTNAMTFGPKKCLVICGVNKITKDINSAIERIKNTASPMNARRLNIETGCYHTGYCVNCQKPERICRVITILEKKPVLSDIEVLIIGAELGF